MLQGVLAVNKKWLKGCFLTLALSGSGEAVFGQVAYGPTAPYGPGSLYRGTSLGVPAQYSAYGSPIQTNPYVAYAQQPEPVVPNPANLIPNQLHQHVPIPNYQQPGNVSPLPPVDPGYPPAPAIGQPQYYGHQAPATQVPQIPYSAETGSGCVGCQQGGWSPYAVAPSHGHSALPYAGGYGQGGGDCGLSLQQPWTMNTGWASPSLWFGGANALFMRAVDSRYVRLTYDSNMPTPALLATNHAMPGFGPGVEGFIGRYINCGRNAIMVNYWSIFENSAMARAAAGPGENLRSDLPFTTLGPGGHPSTLNGLTMPGQNVYDWYDGATVHRLRRWNEFHNIEINLLGFGLGGASLAGFGGGCGGGCGGGFGCGGHCLSRGAGFGGCGAGGFGGCGGCGSCGSCRTCLGGPGAMFVPAPCSRLRFTWLAGFRWFQFNDNFEYATSETDHFFGAGADDFYYRNYVTNNLYGFQLGTLASYCLTQRVNLYFGPKFGIYGNHVQYRTYAGTEMVPATIVSANAYNGMPFNYTFENSNVAFLGELNAGLGVRLSRCFSAYAGYRVIGATGVATGVGQIPYNFSAINAIERINASDSLILHGVYFGGAYNF